jgi:hypothetical protein
MIIINFVDLVKFMLEHWSNYLGVLLLIIMCWFLLMTTVNALLDKLIEGMIGVVISFKHEEDEKK